MKNLFAVCVLVISCTGCEILYDIGQDRALDQCNKIEDYPARLNCLKNNRQSQAAYEKKRQQQIEADNKANVK